MSASKLKLLKNLIQEILGNYTVAAGQPMGAPGNLQNGAVITGQNDSLQNDIDNDEQKRNQDEDAAPQAACCLIVSDDGKILAVSRKKDPTAMGLPGGKVDPAESLEQAAARELKEETGLTAKKLKKVFSMIDSGGYKTTTFLCDAEGEINSDEAGVIRWVTPEVLMSGPFAEYNKALFKRVNIVS